MTALSGEKTLAELSAEFGVHPTMISGWKQELVKRAGELFGRGNKPSDAVVGPSITAGTVMHRSKLPLTVWFWAAHLMATPLQWNVGPPIRGPARHHLQDRLVAGPESSSGEAGAKPGNLFLARQRLSTSRSRPSLWFICKSSTEATL